jgi:hypothetical protein
MRAKRAFEIGAFKESSNQVFFFFEKSQASSDISSNILLYRIMDIIENKINNRTTT